LSESFLVTAGVDFDSVEHFSGTNFATTFEIFSKNDLTGLEERFKIHIK
jgi:hypothetical protein